MLNYEQEAYTLYPKNICATDDHDSYLNSKENKELKFRLSDENKRYGKNNINIVITSVENRFQTKILDHTVPSYSDRCFNWQFVLNTNDSDTEKNIMCINISKVLPVFIVYILEVEYCPEKKRLKYFPRRNKILENDNYISEIQDVKMILTNSSLGVVEFPDKRLTEVIETINFQDIPMGKFTYFNAFFLNEFTTRFA